MNKFLVGTLLVIAALMVTAQGQTSPPVKITTPIQHGGASPLPGGSPVEAEAEVAGVAGSPSPSPSPSVKLTTKLARR